MILVLMKRDAFWRWMPYFAVFVATVRLLSDAYPHSIPAEVFGTQIPLFASLAGLLVLCAQQSDARFLSPLPIALPDIYLARVLSTVSIIWLPLTADLVARLLSRQFLNSPQLVLTLSGAAVSSLVLVILQTALARKNQISPPNGCLRL